MKKVVKSVPVAAQVNVSPAYKAFKSWVENTHLFTVLKRESVRPVGEFESNAIEYNGNRISLNGGVKIEKMEDLPVPMIIQFLENYPLMNDNNTEELKQLLLT